MALLETKNLTFYYPEVTNPALKDISLQIHEGDFVVLCGPSGSGKSTLLRLLKREIAPFGDVRGEILYRGKRLADYNEITIAKEIGMVFQDPENQLVMDRGLEELVFGLENIGISTDEMRKKVAEIVHYFGIQALLQKKIHLLSGGQKQLISLASVLLMEPKLILLDEPTAQLDPIAAKEFLSILQRMNQEFGMTVVIAEHRLEDVFPSADKIVVLNDGEIFQIGEPKKIVEQIWTKQLEKMYPYVPSPSQLYLQINQQIKIEDIPLTVRDGKKWLQSVTIEKKDHSFTDLRNETIVNEKALLSLKNVEFQYDKGSEKILNRLSLTVKEGDWLTIVGANGTGKSSLLKIMANILTPQRGTIYVNGKKLKKDAPLKIGYLPQNPKLLFVHDTVREELFSVIKQHKIKNGEERLNNLINDFKIADMLDRHPYDISGGEMQKVALISTLLTEPPLILLDEPTKGIDPEAREELGMLLKALQQKGLTIVMVTHDIEFAANYSDHCAMLFLGDIAVHTKTAEFFKGNTFYTTVVNRITREANVPEVITVREAIDKWKVM
ncbi:ABC transporter ATP-binding protein [Bacillus kwashiorkori]|uniref:ABC transporter ATP-binding protein n=1 Tax=Bacillus kwashiorkori TaxID=1522318 RepID=UPI000782D209|nr:ABC transporter ATP-binding protein [Bacillus kwashiorkori]